MKELKGFTIRIPVTLAEQIEARAEVTHRSRNQEIVHLLETAIDHSVDRDLQIIQSLRSGQTGS